MDLNLQSRFRRYALAAIFIVALVRLLGFAVQFGFESVQLDFSVFYTAGEALNHGLSPYQNHIAHDPPIWDGACYYRHSFFLYPALAAVLFQPLALLPYIVAKILWIAISLACVVGTLLVTERRFRLNGDWNSWLIVGIFTALFHPLLLLLERGQIDAVTLVVCVTAFSLMQRPGLGRQLAAGGLLSLATLLKLHCVYVLPFVLLRKKWHVAAGYAIGGAFLIFVSSVTPRGPEYFYNYLRYELPRIARHGFKGTDEMKIPAEDLKDLLPNISQRYVIKDETTYRHESFRANRTASGVKLLHSIVGEEGVMGNTAHVSAAVFLCLLVLMGLWHVRYCQKGVAWGEREDFLYWQAVMIVVLLSGPMTWAMNAVWLLPLIVIVLSEYPLLQSPREAFLLCMVFLGMLIVGMPEHITYPLLLPWVSGEVLTHKFTVGKILTCLALIMYLGSRLSREGRHSKGRTVEDGGTVGAEEIGKGTKLAEHSE